MSGVRDKKKQRTEHDILRAAERCFSRSGYRSATMEEIAAAAVVGVGTLYNYFGSKGELLVAIMAGRTDRILRAAAPSLSDFPPDPIDAVTEVMATYTTGFLDIDPDLLRESISLAIARPSGIGRRMVELDDRLMAQLTQLLLRLQAGGRLASDLDVKEAAFVLYAQSMTHLILWTQFGLPSEHEARHRLRGMVELVFRDWREPVPA